MILLIKIDHECDKYQKLYNNLMCYYVPYVMTSDLGQD